MKQWWFFVFVLLVFVFGCRDKVVLNDLQVTACDAAAQNGNCGRLSELGIVTAPECCSALGKCCGSYATGHAVDALPGAQVSLNDYKAVLIGAINSYFSSSPILTTAELKDLIYAYFAAKAYVVDLSCVGVYSKEKCIDIYNKAKGYKCVPNCTGKECGPDGCGGSCGTCTTGKTCNNGQCVTAGNDCTAAGGTCKPNSCSTYNNCSALAGNCTSGYCCTGVCNASSTTKHHKGCYNNNIYWFDVNDKPLELVQNCELDCGYWPNNVICNMRTDGKVETLRYSECFERICVPQGDNTTCYSRATDYPKGVNNIEQTKAVAFTFTDSKQLYNSNPGKYFYVGEPVGQDLYGYGTNVKFIDPEKPKIINIVSTGSTTMKDGSRGPCAIWENNVLVMNPNAKSTGLYMIPTRILSDLIPLYQKNNIIPWRNEVNPYVACEDMASKTVPKSLCIDLTHAMETKEYHKYMDKCEQSFSDSFFYTEEDFVYAKCLAEEQPYKTETSKYMDCGNNRVCGSGTFEAFNVCGGSWHTREQFLTESLRDYVAYSMTNYTKYTNCKVSFDADGGKPLCCDSGCAWNGECKPEGTTTTGVYGPIDSLKYGNTNVEYVCKDNQWKESNS